MFLFLGIGILQLINLRIAIGFLIVEKEPKKKGIYVFFVLANIIAPLILFFLPLSRLQERMDFATKKEKRESYAQSLFEDKDLLSAGYEMLAMDDSSENLSKGNQVAYIKNEDAQECVLFFTQTGIPDGYSGFIYCNNSGKPGAGNLPENPVKIDSVEGNWFRVVAN